VSAGVSGGCFGNFFMELCIMNEKCECCKYRKIGNGEYYMDSFRIVKRGFC
jgi:hypothetical protein